MTTFFDITISLVKICACTRQLGFLTDSRMKNVVAKKNAQSV